jgi:hypothetical protein
MPEFSAGDLLIAATDVDDQNVDLRKHAGPGRILHYDANFRLLGELRTGQTGLVVGLALDPGSRQLYACDPVSQTISVFTPGGALLGLAGAIPRGRYGSLLFRSAGEFVAGLHSRIGEKPDEPAPRLLVGKIDARRARGLTLQIDGGKLGFHCVTHMALAPDKRTLVYVSEGGRRVMRFDLLAERQQPDWLTLPPDDSRGSFGPAVLPDGRLWIATGRGAELYDAAGTLLTSIAPELDRGWSRLTLSNDAACFYLGNFVAGLLERRRADNGQLLASLDIYRRYSLAGLVEVAA